MHIVLTYAFMCVGNGRQAAKHLLAMGNNEKCPDVDGFSSDMVTLFKTYVLVAPLLRRLPG